jgi:hypothetical protein
MKLLFHIPPEAGFPAISLLGFVILAKGSFAIVRTNPGFM